MTEAHRSTRRPGRRAGLLAAALLAGALLAACGSSSTSSSTTTSPATTSAPTTTSPATTTSSTTGAPCTPKPVSATGGAATMTVTPGTCLKNGQSVTVTGSGFSSNATGGISQCNGADNQPTVSVAGNQVPVGCTNPLTALTTTSSSGALDTVFKVATGVIGPPAPGTDSAGGKAATDAKSYPCPPTASQAAAGATCALSFGDSAGDQVSVPISFAPTA